MFNDSQKSQDPKISRREFLAGSIGSASAIIAHNNQSSFGNSRNRKSIHTVLGSIDPYRAGVILTHEHAPTVDWSELYQTKPAPIASKKILEATSALLNLFYNVLGKLDKPGTIVEATPIRVGRYPHLLVQLARMTRVQIVACTGFWCEAFAPQHPWALTMSLKRGGINEMTKLFVREITEGMEDPKFSWGEKFTNIRAGAIKIGTSTYLRPSERAVHEAAAAASKETGCPILTHTTNGGGLEEARLLIRSGVDPKKLMIGHQGHMDDRKNEEANEYHIKIADLGCYLQFDRVGSENYNFAKQARQVKFLVSKGFLRRIVVSHDHVPYFYGNYMKVEKGIDGWRKGNPDYTLVSKKLVTSLKKLDMSDSEIRTILVENPQRCLAF